MMVSVSMRLARVSDRRYDKRNFRGRRLFGRRRSLGCRRGRRSGGRHSCCRRRFSCCGGGRRR